MKREECTTTTMAMSELEEFLDGELGPERAAEMSAHLATCRSCSLRSDALLAERAMYATAKAAVIQYTRCLAAQLRSYDVGVNVVAPGGIVTPRFVATRPVDEARMVERGTFERYGRPIEIATAVAFLASRDGNR